MNYRIATEEENEAARAQLRDGARDALEAAKKRGYKLHPKLADRRRALSRYADDKAVEGFAKVCEQQGVETRTDDLAAFLTKPDAEQVEGIEDMAKMLGKD